MQTSLKRVVCLLPLLWFLALSGCILSPKEDPNPPPVVTYKPLTERENLIDNLVLTYKDCNIDEYTKLLHADYIWYNQAEDVQNGKQPFYSRDDDITLQKNMFMAKIGTYPDPNKLIDAMSLSIDKAAWQEVTEIGGVPCVECFETTRPYHLSVTIRQGPTTYIGEDLIHYVVTAVQANGRKEWRILRADDINNPQTP